MKFLRAKLFLKKSSKWTLCSEGPLKMISNGWYVSVLKQLVQFTQMLVFLLKISHEFLEENIVTKFERSI